MLNKREIMLITILFLCVFGFCIYKFVYVPKTAEMEALQAELQSAVEEKAAAERRIEAIPMAEADIAMEEAVANDGAPLFFSDLVQENLILLLDELSRGVPLHVDSYSFSEVSVGGAPAYDTSAVEHEYELKQLADSYILKHGTLAQNGELPEQETAEVENGSAGQGAEQLPYTSVNLTFMGTYEEIVSYIKALEDYEKAIVLSSVGLSGQSGDVLSGSMTLNFYMLPKLAPTDADEAFLEWKHDLPKGKTTPFDGGGAVAGESASNQASGAGIASQQQNSQPVSYKNPDFFVIARSYTSGMPTMTVGYGPDTAAETYIRNTNEGDDSVTVELTMQNGRYYYRFVTDTRTYPETGNVSFAPREDDIRFIIYSSKRTSDDDTNQINVNIVNKTGLKLNWAVNGDDKERPRVNVVVR